MIYVILVMALVWKGAAVPFAFLPTCILVGLATVLACLKPPREPVFQRYVLWSVGLAGALALLALLQSVTLPWNPLEHPIWRWAADLVSIPGGAVSVNPAMTRQAVLTLLAPFLVFACVLAFFGDDEKAFRLIKFLALVGVAFCAFGIVQITVLDRSLLFFEKVHYVDSLTSTFVNRNTAGTLLGVASFAMLTWMMGIFRGVSFKTERPSDPFVRTSVVDKRYALVFTGVAAFFIILSLLLTRSRGAALAAMAAYLVALPMLFNEIGSVLARRHYGPKLPTLSRAVRGTALAAGSIAIFFVLFGGLTSSRFEQGGIDQQRLCVYTAGLRAFADRWMFGTGFGNFQSIFPMYRMESCNAVDRFVLRAHNVYIEGLAGFGILFVPALILGYWMVLKALWTGYRTRRRYRFVAVTGLGALTLVSTHSLVDFSVQIPGMAIYFAAFLGAVLSICLRRADKPSTETVRMVV